MNGEIVHICKIVMSAKKALMDHTDISFINNSYINQIQFIFLPKMTLIGKKINKANSVSEWFEMCKKRKLIDIKFLIPIKLKNINILGFTNTSQSSMFCFYENGDVTYFTAKWEFNKEKKLWDVVYQEYNWENHSHEIPHFENNTDSLKSVLLEIEKLAYSIKADFFAKRFHKAYECLCGFIDENEEQENISQLPKQYRNIYIAIRYADVFGAMGSWNDSPPYMAEECGLYSEYERLSNELLTQLRLGLLYVTNECWNS